MMGLMEGMLAPPGYPGSIFPSIGIDDLSPHFRAAVGDDLINTVIDQFPCSGANLTGVTPKLIRDSLMGSEMMTTQRSVSLPAIQRYVTRLVQGESPPPIRVDAGIVVDGNHRYISGRVFGIDVAQVPGTMAPSQRANAMPIREIEIDLTDWGNY